jgi:tetratricopeptide (TPR) repeat protein
LSVRRFHYLPLSLLFLVCACTQDPNILKQKYLQNGDNYYRRGQFRQASVLYRTALKKDARFGTAYLHLARADLQLGLLSQASPALARAVELLPEGPDRVEARIRLANLYIEYLENARYDRLVADEVARLANDLIALDPKSYQGFRIRGQVASLDAAEIAKTLHMEGKKRLGEAISDLRAAESIHPFGPGVLISLSRCLWANGQPQEAEKYLLSAVEYHKQRLASYSAMHYQELGTAYVELVRLYTGVGRQQDAEKILRQAIDNTAGGSQQNLFRAELAELLERLGRREEMAAVLNTLKAHSADFHQAYEISGALYLKLGDSRQAVHEYEQGMAAFPKNKVHYQQLMIDALVSSNQRDEAEVLNNAILKESPTDADARVRRAGFLLDKGDAETSIRELEAMLEQAPNNPLIHYNLGRAFLSRHNPEQARVHFAQAIRSDGKLIPPRLAEAEIELSAGEFGRGVTSAEQILALDSKNAEAMLIRAVGLSQMGKLDEARAGFEFLLAMYPRYDQALLQFGNFYATEKKPKEAEALYRKSFEANPGNLGGLVAIVRSLLVKNQTGEALKTIKAAMVKYPNRPDLEVLQAETEMNAGQVDVAISQYQALLKKQEKDPRAVGDLHFRLADCYKRQGNLQNAIAQLEQARSLMPNTSPVLHNLGVIYDMLGQKAKAKTFYEASLKLNGNDPTVLNNLAFYMAENGGDLDQALTYAQRARQKMPHDLAFVDTVGVIYLKKNLVDNALDILQDLVDKKPNEPAFHLHLAEAFLRKGDTAKGRQELKTALADRPSAEEAATIQQLLSKTGT